MTTTYLKIGLKYDADWSSDTPHHVYLMKDGKLERTFKFATTEEARTHYDNMCKALKRAHHIGVFLRIMKDAVSFIIIAVLTALFFKWIT